MIRRTKQTKTSKVISKKSKKKKTHLHEHPLSSETEFTNRESGWLNFNRRVLHEAMDSRTPLLERIRFLGICNSNLDEFFMKRVGGLKRQVALGIVHRSSDGKTAPQQLQEIRVHVLQMLKEQTELFLKTLKPALKENKIELLNWGELSLKEKEWLHKYYLKNVFPVLTPLSVDPGHPFPFISNLSTSLGVTMKHPDRDERFFARIKVPRVLNQWIRIELDQEKFKFVSLLEVIKENLSGLFPSMQVMNVMPFRLTRNADITRDEEDAEDLLSMIEEELRLRRFAEVVRLEHGPNPDPWMLKFLMDELELTDDDVYEIKDELDYTTLEVISDLKLPQLKYEPWTPVVPPAFLDENPQSIFQVIQHADQLVHHPYESFSATVEKFIHAAAEDPKVLAIKMTLYRTGDKSPFIRSLIRAAESGKQVVCLVELKARFDEERNIYWAQELENAGVHVVYGVVGLKTHAKTALVVRQESEGLKCYAHIGTGNYNVATSRFYTDFGLLTCHPDITGELVEFFHFLTGRSLKNTYDHLLIAPVNLFSKMKAMIEREADHAKNGKPSQIFAKMNNMEENDIAMALYNASQRGTDITLVVRGFCCLRPGVLGLSEKVKVLSVIGRFLEHSRVFYFRNGQEDPLNGDFFIGSADWMYRNLHARVECLVPIYDRGLRERLWELIQLHIKDQRQTWDMHLDGRYTQRKSNDPGIQMQLAQNAKARAQAIEEDSDSGQASS